MHALVHVNKNHSSVYQTRYNLTKIYNLQFDMSTAAQLWPYHKVQFIETHNKMNGYSSIDIRIMQSQKELINALAKANVKVLS